MIEWLIAAATHAGLHWLREEIEKSSRSSSSSSSSRSSDGTTAKQKAGQLLRLFAKGDCSNESASISSQGVDTYKLSCALSEMSIYIGPLNGRESVGSVLTKITEKLKQKGY